MRPSVALRAGGSRPIRAPVRTKWPGADGSHGPRALAALRLRLWRPSGRHRRACAGGEGRPDASGSRPRNPGASPGPKIRRRVAFGPEACNSTNWRRPGLPGAAWKVHAPGGGLRARRGDPRAEPRAILERSRSDLGAISERDGVARRADAGRRDSVGRACAGRRVRPGGPVDRADHRDYRRQDGRLASPDPGGPDFGADLEGRGGRGGSLALSTWPKRSSSTNSGSIQAQYRINSGSIQAHLPFQCASSESVNAGGRSLSCGAVTTTRVDRRGVRIRTSCAQGTGPRPGKEAGENSGESRRGRPSPNGRSKL